MDKMFQFILLVVFGFKIFCVESGEFFSLTNAGIHIREVLKNNVNFCEQLCSQDRLIQTIPFRVGNRM